MLDSISPSQIIWYFNIGMWVLFAAVISAFVVGFLRGLKQGWKYGTYRFIFFAALICTAIFTLRPLANSVANFSLAGFNIPQIGVVMNIGETPVSISLEVTTIKETCAEFLRQLFQALNVKADPNTVTELVLAIALSFASIIALFIELALIVSIGNFLCLILWHLIFKRFIPREIRKKKTKRVISGFEQAVTSVVVLALFISPLTGMLNGLSRGFERIPEEEQAANSVVVDSDIYQTITGLLDTYDSSLFNQMFFSWYADSETGMRFDEAFLAYISSIDLSNGQTFTIVNEFSNIIKVASYAVNSGLLGEGGFNSQALSVFATSQYAPKLLRAIGQSGLIQQIAPMAFEILLNIDAISQYVMTVDGIDVSHYDHAGTFDKLANLYESVISSGIINEVIDAETGEFVVDTNHISNIFGSGYKQVFDSIFDTLSSDELTFFNDIIVSALYVQAVKEYKGDGSSAIGIKDFLPELSEEELLCNDRGIPMAIPTSIKSINFLDEIKMVFNTLYDLINVDEAFLPLILEPIFDEGKAFDEETIGKLVTLVLDNAEDVEKYIDGKNLEEGKACLLDSTLIANATSSFLGLLGNSINESMGLDDENAIDLSDIVTEYKAKDLNAKKEAAKKETRSLFGVLLPLIQCKEGKALIQDFDNLPGLYFDKTGAFLGAKEGLLEALAQGLSSIDNSKIFSNLLPALLNKYVSGEDGFLKQSLGIDLTLDFAPKDSSGNSILGHEIAKIIRTYSECQDSITLLMSAFSGSSDIKTLEKTFSTLCSYKTSSNELQLTKLISAIGDSKIFNPATIEGCNGNIYQLFKMIFDTVGFLDSTMDNHLKDIIMVETFDIGSETNGLLGLVQHLCDNNMLGSLTAGLSLETIANIEFQPLFEKVGSSELLKTILADIIDENLGSVAIFSYVDEGGETVQLSFANITDWGSEGAALDTMTKYASMVGDISSISFESLSPEMISSMFGYLSSSQLFVKTNEDGTYDWLFPSYLASKIVKIAKGAGDIGKFFTDLEETYEGSVYKVEGKDPSSDESYEAIKDQILQYDVKNASSMDPITDGKAEFAQEGQRLANIIRCLGASGALNMISDGAEADFRNFKTTYFSVLLDDMSESILMGKTGISQILSIVVDMLKDSVEPFKNTNVMYAFNTDDPNERKEVGDALVTVIDAAINPVTGFLDVNGKIDMAKFEHLEDLDPYHFVAPLVHALNSTEVFTTLSTFQHDTAGMTKSAFLSEMADVLNATSWYENEATTEAMLPLIDADVQAHGGWDVEIDNFVEVFASFKTIGLSIETLSFDSFFKEEKYGVDVIANALIAVNNSRLLYPGLPSKLDSAISALDSGDISLSNANPYFAGKANIGSYVYATNPFDEDECYKLASILGKAASLSTLDISDLSAFNEESVKDVTSLLADFAQSKVFNTLKEGKVTSVFQDVLGEVLGGDASKYYYNAISPKDTANASNYTNAKEKAYYIANLKFPYISNTNSNADVSSITDDSDPRSLRSFLNVLVSETDFVDIISASSDMTIDTLTQENIEILLNALNKCDWTYDFVPNAIADSIKYIGDLDGIELKRLNPFYQYDYTITLVGDEYENSGILLGAPNYENRYDSDEIELVANIVDIAKTGSDLITNVASKTTVLRLRNFLDALNDSYSFHLAAPSYLFKADDSLDFTSTDLPVFEQAMYSLYKQSGLASLAYNEVYDGQYATYEDKLLDAVKNYPDSSWSNELATLMINETMDKGLFSVAFDLGLVDGSGNVSLSSSELLSKSPVELSSVLYTANDMDITQGMVAYELQKIIQDTINFGMFSKTTAIYDVNASSYALGLDNTVYELEITMTSGPAPTVSYHKAGSEYSVTPTGSNPYTYALYNGTTIQDRPLARDISITGEGTIASIKTLFASDMQVGLTKAQYDTVIDGNHVGAINELVTIADNCLYNHVTSAYVDFASDLNAVADLFSTSGNVTNILNFIKSEHSFFVSPYDSSFNKAEGTIAFDSGDICFSNMIAFQYGSYGVNLFEYMPDYEAGNRVPGLKNLHEIFSSQPTIEEACEWLDANILKAASFQGMYKAIPTIAGKAGAIPYFEFTDGQTIDSYLVNSADWCTFESAFKTGFARTLYNDMRNGAMSSSHFTLNIDSTTLYSPSEEDFQGFLDLTKDSLIPLLRDLSYSALTNVNEAADILDELANISPLSPYKDVVSSYYEKAIYEALLLNMSLDFATQPTNHPEPFGVDGYLRNAALILNPSL